MADPITRLNSALDGRYRIERQLGEGGMATVYLADDLRHGRRVALKVLKPELAAVVGAERFLAEIRTTANLQHPHILPLFDSGEAGGFLFYVMPYVEGESLRQRLDRVHQLPVDESVRIARDVAEALQAAHEQGVIHRDVKPANILLNRDQPLVADFGIALAVSAAGGGRLTETGLSLGTPHYMSPEQATGDPGVGAASDIYALGCVLYEMLAGAPPHVGSSAQAILARIVTEEAEPVTKHRKSVPANVEDAIAKALEKVAADRFASAADFARALADERYRHGGRVDGTPRSRPFRLVAALVVGLLAGSAAAAAASAWLDRGGSGETLLFFEAPPQGTRFLEAPLPSPDGRTLAMLVTDSASGSKIWVRSLADPQARELDGTERASLMAWSPDGEELLFQSGPELRRVRVDGSGNRLVASMQVRAAAWMPDGRLVVSSGAFGNYGIMTLPAAGGTPQAIVEGAQFRDLDVVGAGPRLLYGQFGGETGIHALDLSDGEHSSLVPGANSRARYVAPDFFVYARDRVLLAQRFDPAEMSLVGDPFPVARDVGNRFFAGGAAGALTFIQGRSDTQRLLWFGRNGELLGEAAPEGDYTEVYLSPDGTRMMFARSDAVTGNVDLWIQDLQRDARPTRFTTGADIDHLAAFSPDGTAIAWEDHAGGGLHLVRRLADGSAPAATVRPWGRGGGPVDWSPDGGFVLYRSDDGATGWNLWAVPMDGGGEPFPLVESTFSHAEGRFSPDGRWLAFTSDASGQTEIYLQRLDGMSLLGGPQRVSAGGASQPLWRRDGTELFFLSGGTLMVVETRLALDSPAGTPRPLFDIGDPAARNEYAVSPDGQRFLAIVSAGTGTAGSATVVLDWAAGVERR